MGCKHSHNQLPHNKPNNLPHDMKEKPEVTGSPFLGLEKLSLKVSSNDVGEDDPDNKTNIDTIRDNLSTNLIDSNTPAVELFLSHNQRVGPDETKCKDDPDNNTNIDTIRGALEKYLTDSKSKTPTVEKICVNGCEAGNMHHMPTDGKVMPNEEGTKLIYKPTSTFSCSLFLCTKDTKKPIDPDNIRILFVWCEETIGNRRPKEYKWFMGSPCLTGPVKEGKQVNFINKEITSKTTANVRSAGIDFTNKGNGIGFNEDKFVWSRSSTNENNFQIFKNIPNKEPSEESIKWYWKAPNGNEDEAVSLTNSDNMAHFNFIQT